ncbi:MAG: endopeptidase La [Endozoicomonadaceae bacterium]|nr:endopeptidase La [Endozoicomonadaceae bacterium]
MECQDSTHCAETVELPLLPLRDVVVYPHMVIPLFVGRDKSIKALERAMEGDRRVFLVAQKSAQNDDPNLEDIYRVGTLSTILQMLKLPDGTVKVLVEGVARANINEFKRCGDYCSAVIAIHEEQFVDARRSEIFTQTLYSKFEQYVHLSKKVSTEVLNSLSEVSDPERLTDTVSSHMVLKTEDEQKILEITDILERLEYLVTLIDTEIELIQVDRRVRGRVKKQMEKSQRDYYLNEQMKAIQKELGDSDDNLDEFESIKKNIEQAGMTSEALNKTMSELKKLKQMSPMSAEATVVRGYIDWMLNVPWKKRSKVRHDLKKAEQILNEDHYGLEEVKDRILEYLAVQQRVKKLNGPVLCLVGPPGVGKTSLGGSIARATGRKFVRMALGGVRDEAEIRGHRRTYVGSMPGKLIQKLAGAGVKNPLFLLDEVDKMGSDMRGDPASALLEVLDPEQNNCFNDHYLEVDYDLSDVMFVCTSNSMDIPPALLDRMEVIRISGYTEQEKIHIYERYLLSKQMKNVGMKKNETQFDEHVIRNLVRYYTREAGVRGLERELAKICRKLVKEQALGVRDIPSMVTVDDLEHYSGIQKYSYGLAEEKDQIGQVTGLAWTPVGGELLTIEAMAVKGRGQVIKTGSLGDVMQESIQAAMTVIRSRALVLGIKSNFHKVHDVHIHVPEGATPKDGPSAGIAMCTALASIFTSIPVRADVAMTGEITLRGQVLAIGGLKEKLLAAHRGGIHTVIIPSENKKDLKEIPDNIKQDLEICPVKWIDEVLDLALKFMPEAPLKVDESVTVNKEEEIEHEALARGDILSTH